MGHKNPATTLGYHKVDVSQANQEIANRMISQISPDVAVDRRTPRATVANQEVAKVIMRAPQVTPQATTPQATTPQDTTRQINLQVTQKVPKVKEKKTIDSS